MLSWLIHIHDPIAVASRSAGMCFREGNLSNVGIVRRSASWTPSFEKLPRCSVYTELAAVIDCVIVPHRMRECHRVTRLMVTRRTGRLDVTVFLLVTPCGRGVMRSVCWKCQAGDVSSGWHFKGRTGARGGSHKAKSLRRKTAEWRFHYCTAMSLYECEAIVNSESPLLTTGKWTNKNGFQGRTAPAVKMSEFLFDSIVLSFTGVIIMPAWWKRSRRWWGWSEADINS